MHISTLTQYGFNLLCLLINVVVLWYFRMIIYNIAGLASEFSGPIARLEFLLCEAAINDFSRMIRLLGRR